MGSIRAVAGKVWREAFRLRTAWLFGLLLAGLLLAYPSVLAGDGSLRGRLQMFLSYGAGTAGLLLAVLTIVLAAATLTGEIERREIQLLATKPIHRAAVLAGKWLGVLLVDAAWLALAGALLWIGAERILASGKAAERAQARNRLLVARDVARPDPRPVDPRRKRDLLERLLADERFMRGRSAAEVERAVERVMRITTIRSGDAASWTFRGVRPVRREGEEVILRYRYHASPVPPSESVRLAWDIGPRTSPDRFARRTRTSAGDVHEIRAPARLVGGDGTLEVRVRHDDPYPCAVLFEPDQGLRALYRVGGFGANLARGLLLILLRLAFLAAVTLLAASFLSQPVALLAGLAMLLVATGSGFFLEGLAYQIHHAAPAKGAFLRIVETAWGYAYTAILRVLPNFGPYDPSASLADGRAIPWGRVLEALGVLGLLQGGVATLAACWAFGRREIGRA